MKVHRYIAGAIIVCVMASQSAFAQDYRGRGPQDQGGRGGYGQQGGRDQPDGRYRHDGRFQTERGPGYSYGNQPYRGPAGYREPMRGAGPQHNWYRGNVLPGYYRTRYYVVDDWRLHRLYSPPRGYHWVQVGGGDYVLAAIATGVILSVLLNQ